MIVVCYMHDTHRTHHDQGECRAASNRHRHLCPAGDLPGQNELDRIKTTYTAWHIERQDGHGFIAIRIHGPHRVIHERSLDRFDAR
jgi:hypothetical protein